MLLMHNGVMFHIAYMAVNLQSDYFALAIVANSPELKYKQGRGFQGFLSYKGMAAILVM